MSAVGWQTCGCARGRAHSIDGVTLGPFGGAARKVLPRDSRQYSFQLPRFRGHLDCAVSSVVERLLDTEEVRGSKPLSRTIFHFLTLRDTPRRRTTLGPYLQGILRFRSHGRLCQPMTAKDPQSQIFVRLFVRRHFRMEMPTLPPRRAAKTAKHPHTYSL